MLALEREIALESVLWLPTSISKYTSIAIISDEIASGTDSKWAIVRAEAQHTQRREATLHKHADQNNQSPGRSPSGQWPDVVLRLGTVGSEWESKKKTPSTTIYPHSVPSRGGRVKSREI